MRIFTFESRVLVWFQDKEVINSYLECLIPYDIKPLGGVKQLFLKENLTGFWLKNTQFSKKSN